MTLTVLLFARARELAATDSMTIELPEGAAVSALRRALSERIPALVPLLAVSMIAVNQEFAAETQVLAAADELAVIPPVSGGTAFS
jgi:molybdopterin converting factor subunit 1